MPRLVDSDARRRDILETAVAILAESGLQGLSFRAIAQRLGGSSTLVTHYYRSRRDMLVDLTSYTIEKGKAQLSVSEHDVDDPLARLHTLLLWLVPDDPQSLREEHARLNLMQARDSEPEIAHFFEEWEREVRQLLRSHLEPLVPAAEIDSVTDFLRTVTNGLCLGAVEHPDKWTPERQEAVVARAIDGLRSVVS
ncbi:TetR/AcrR family transcriptional regulator [Microbispora sp. NEAU-D428]|uniref:TetR/AcrR family transcriptional regulator n=1 Tax=Microbispora sitophila TaxID=2771537 RepID=UPI001865E2E6|nr:TetR/AcrR family transcriptional regulator [Microbispora sitophila]MBE3013795.1 TetR/AcrR family transcriptional regulator [Microbispora sitophila]